MIRGAVRSVLLVLAAVLLCVAPLVVRHDGPRGEFQGTDSRAVSEITDSHPGYRPWVRSVPRIASTEVRSGLFAVQAGLGGLALGYVIGFLRGRRRVSDGAGSVQRGGTSV